MKNRGISLSNTKSVFRILKESSILYFDNFADFTKPMIFPIVAHLISIPYIILISYYFPTVFPLESLQDMALVIALGTVILTIPGFILFFKGFWAYIVVIVSLNRYAKAVILEDKAVNIKACNEYVNSRKKSYIYILMIMMLIWIAGFLITTLPFAFTFILHPCITGVLVFSLGLFSFISLIVISVYLSLSFQVFAFEDPGIPEVFHRSFKLVDNNFWRTFLLIIILSIITSIIAPVLIDMLFRVTGVIDLTALSIKDFLARFIDALDTQASTYPESMADLIKTIVKFMNLHIVDISKSLVTSIIDGVVTAGMLPLGTICFTLLYYDILNRKGEVENN